MALDDSELDGQLAARIVSGPDASAEAELCRRLFPRIRAYGLRRLRSEPDALDLAQQVLVVVIQALRAGQVQEPERIAAFVMGASRNTLLDRHKIERRRDELLRQFGAAQSEAYEPFMPLDAAALEACLQHLSARDRAIVVSTYVEEQSAADIALSLGLQAVTVRVTRHRALKQLLECMGGAA